MIQDIIPILTALGGLVLAVYFLCFYDPWQKKAMAEGFLFFCVFLLSGKCLYFFVYVGTSGDTETLHWTKPKRKFTREQLRVSFSSM